jgi:hypothetical protein
VLRQRLVVAPLERNVLLRDDEADSDGHQNADDEKDGKNDPEANWEAPEEEVLGGADLERTARNDDGNFAGDGVVDLIPYENEFRRKEGRE